MDEKIGFVLLSCVFLVLAGCTTAESQDESTPSSIPVAPPNHAPEILVDHMNHLEPVVNFSSSYNASLATTLSMINYSILTVYHAVIDIDQDNMTMGYDINLDGHIDVNVTNLSGYTNITVHTTLWNEHPSMSGIHRMSVAFIAIDEHGLGSSSFIDTSFDIESLEWWNDENYFPNQLYVFDGEDAGGSQPSTETDDNLIRITMTQGGDIQWSAISVKIEVDGEAPVTCDNPGQDGTGQCVLVEFGDDTDTVLTAGDGFTIKENGQDLCSSSCSIDITITDTRFGQIIDEVNDIVAE